MTPIERSPWACERRAAAASRQVALAAAKFARLWILDPTRAGDVWSAIAPRANRTRRDERDSDVQGWHWLSGFGTCGRVSRTPSIQSRPRVCSPTL